MEAIISPADAYNYFLGNWSAKEKQWILFSIGFIVLINIFVYFKSSNKKVNSAIRAGTTLIAMGFLFYMFLDNKLLPGGFIAYSSIFFSTLIICVAFLYFGQIESSWAIITFFILITGVFFTSVYHFAHSNAPLGIAFMVGLLLGWLISIFFQAVLEFTNIQIGWKTTKEEIKENNPPPPKPKW
jgi:hypothetical protein